jgi:hypothetical protein
MVDAIPPKFVAGVVTKLYVAPIGLIETTVTDCAAPLYAEVVAEAILHVTEVTGIAGFQVISHVGDIVVTPVNESVISQNNFVFPAVPRPDT